MPVVSEAVARLGTGRVGGRSSAEEITIFDSSGMAIQGLAIGGLAVERAIAGDLAQQVEFAEG